MSRLTRKYLLWATTILAGAVAALVAGAYLLGQQMSGQQAGFPWAALTVGVAVAVLALLALWIILRRITEPLDWLASALHRAARGDFAADAGGKRGRELDGLFSAFEFMRDKLQESVMSRDYFDRLIANISEAILVTDAADQIARTNVAATTLLGYENDGMLGIPISDIVDESKIDTSRKKLGTTPRDGVFIHRDQTPVPVSYTVSELRGDDGELEGRIYAAQNVAERRRVEQRIRYLARTDSLTKLPNRMQFQHQLQQSIARARREGQYLALLYLDIDRFKDVNDTFGHPVGDTSLETFAQRILSELPEGATAGRLAGDEFAVLITGSEVMDGLGDRISGVATDLLAAIGQPFQVQSEEVFITTSMGIALYPIDGDNVIDLLRNADAALYQAKRAGGNCFEFYASDMNTATVERLMLKSKLRRSFEREELRVHYQPKYNLENGRVEGAEALVRWDLPDRGLIFPSDFIPLAEETNLILQLGEWVLNQVCEDYRLWQRSLPSPGRVSVNLSLKQLQQQRFLERVQMAFKTHAVSPTCLELEITETTLMEDTDRTIRLLDALYGMGLHLTIDDFGTGYSSLSALQRFPISTLKIDRSFVRDVTVDKDDATMVTTIIQMARGLQLDVVAEGVESQQQLDFLRALGCDYAQGHLFGDPMTAAEFRNLLIDQAAGGNQYRALFA